ncbi:MAG: recombinase family protein [Streptosporangiaceae bacterium]
MAEVINAAIWLRVSSSDGRQHRDNQVPDVERFADHHGYEIGPRYEVDDTAWKDGGGAEYKATLKRALDAAWQGKFKVIIVWALDRITREGAEGALRLIRQFRERGVTLVSVKESWLNGSPEIQDVLVAFAGWVAEQESARRSERVRIGMARARAEGKQVGGRKPGARNRVQGKPSPAIAAAWSEERRAALAERNHASARVA